MDEGLLVLDREAYAARAAAADAGDDDQCKVDVVDDYLSAVVKVRLNHRRVWGSLLAECAAEADARHRLDKALELLGRAEAQAAGVARVKAAVLAPGIR